MPEKAHNIAIAWYRPDQWDLLLTRSEDAEDLETSHAEWLAHAQEASDELRRAGLNAVPVDVDVEALVLWCETSGKSLNATARANYAVYALRQREQDRDQQ